MTSAARHHEIVAAYKEHGYTKAAGVLGVNSRTVYRHVNGWECNCLRQHQYGSTPRTCAQHGHAERPGPWGLHCPDCGLALPERTRGKGRWVALGHGRMWVSE